MSLPLKLNFSDYDNFLTEPNYTTSAEAQGYFRNMDMLVEALIDVGLWQPETSYPNGHVVFSPNMPNGTEAVCVATNGGKSSNTEPSWGEVGGDNVSDGTCFWKLRWKHWSKDGYAMADYPLRDKAYSLNAIVACPYHAEYFLKCTQAGTTSTGSLDTTSATLGKVYTDGGVKWEVKQKVWEAATQDQAEMGTDNTTAMTPKGVNFRLNKDYKIKTFTGYADLGLIVSELSIDSIINAMPTYSLISFYCEPATSPNLKLPVGVQYAYLTVYKTGGTSRLECIRLGGANAIKYIGFYTGNIFLGWREEAFTPVGTIIAYVGNDVPKGYLNCSGASLKPTTYSDLFAVIGISFGGDGVNTFNLPNLNNNSFLEGSDTVGIVKEAGLPNILGQAGGATCEGVHKGEETSALYAVKTATNGRAAGSGGGVVDIALDASRNNLIYGKSDTVQPKSVTVKFCIKY